MESIEFQPQKWGNNLTKAINKSSERSYFCDWRSRFRDDERTNARLQLHQKCPKLIDWLLKNVSRPLYNLTIRAESLGLFRYFSDRLCVAVDLLSISIFFHDENNKNSDLILLWAIQFLQNSLVNLLRSTLVCAQYLYILFAY